MVLGDLLQLLGSRQKGRAQKKLIRGSQEALRGLKSSRQEFTSGMEDLIRNLPQVDLSDLNLEDLNLSDINLSDLSVLSELNLDQGMSRRDIEEIVSNAREQQKMALSGRITGAEMMRDTVRQTGADAFARARNVGSTGLDLLGAIGAIQGGENEAMRSVDIEELNRRQSAIDFANERVNQALSERITFDRDVRDFERQNALAEFQAAREAEITNLNLLRQREFQEANFRRSGELAMFDAQRSNRMAEFDARRSEELERYRNQLLGVEMRQNLLGANRDMQLQEIAQRGAITSAQAARMSSLGDVFSGIGRRINDAESQILSAILGGMGTGAIGGAGAASAGTAMGSNVPWYQQSYLNQVGGNFDWLNNSMGR